jgi:hypothetical protein
VLLAKPSYLPCSLVSVHYWHVAVHEYNSEAYSFEFKGSSVESYLFEGIFAVVGNLTETGGFSSGDRADDYLQSF